MSKSIIDHKMGKRVAWMMVPALKQVNESLTCVRPCVLFVPPWFGVATHPGGNTLPRCPRVCARATHKMTPLKVVKQGSGLSDSSKFFEYELVSLEDTKHFE